METYYDVSFSDYCWKSIKFVLVLMTADVPPFTTSYRRISNSGVYWYDDCEIP